MGTSRLLTRTWPLARRLVCLALLPAVRGGEIADAARGASSRGPSPPAARVDEVDATPVTGSRIPRDFAHIEAAAEEPRTLFSRVDLDRLYRKFKASWNPTYRTLPPVPLQGGPLAVGVRLELVKFQGLDEVAGTVNLVLDLLLRWSDDRLSLGSGTIYAGGKLRVAPELVWKPDIVVLNQVTGLEHMFETDSSPVILADDAFRRETGANVLWRRRINMRSRCGIDMSDFPFDTQLCSVIIGSWSSSRRQMLLVPEGSHQKLDSGGSLHASDFRVRNMTVSKRDVYSRNAAERFEEICYDLVLQRYPHFYIINFMLPMVAVTMLTVATMWMSSAGTRMNSATRLLLCIVQIMNITSSWRPANDADIWLDRFQSHCLALTMSSVLQSLVMDYLLKTGLFEFAWAPKAHVVDTILRTAICLTTIVVFAADLCALVKEQDVSGLYGSFHANSSKILLGFVYVIFTCLGASSILSTVWLVLPTRAWRSLCCTGCATIASGVEHKASSTEDA